MEDADAFGLFVHTRGRPPGSVMSLIDINSVLAVPSFPTRTHSVLENIMVQTTIDYLERRYAALEKELEGALQIGATDHLAISELIFRKLVIAEEIKHNRRLVELIRRPQTGQR